MSIAIQNRNETYLNILNKLPKSEKNVYESIKDLGVASLDTICFNLNKTKNELSGRLTSLKFKCLIKEVSKGVSTRSNNKVTNYQATTQDERIDLINAKYQSLIDKKNSLVRDY